MDVALAVFGALNLAALVVYVVRERRWLHRMQAMAAQCRRDYEAERDRFKPA